MVDIYRDALPVRVRSPIIYTPTFVLADNGREVGRIEGYPGDAFFWGLLESLLEHTPPPKPRRPLTGRQHSSDPERAL
jgi:hypothetical protein